MVLLKSNPGEIGSMIIDFSLPSVDGKIYSPDSFQDKKLLIIVFMCNHCPYVKAIIGRLVAFQERNSEKSVQLIGINPNDTSAYPEDSFENMKLFANKHKMNFPYLQDETQETAGAFDAVCTPDIYLYDSGRKLRYRGRLDDNWQDESAVTEQDLQKAADLLLQGKEIDFKMYPSMGCSIKWIK